MPDIDRMMSCATDRLLALVKQNSHSFNRIEQAHSAVGKVAACTCVANSAVRLSQLSSHVVPCMLVDWAAGLAQTDAVIFRYVG